MRRNLAEEELPSPKPHEYLRALTELSVNFTAELTNAIDGLVKEAVGLIKTLILADAFN